MPDIRKSISPNKEFDKSELRERLTPTQYQVTQEHHTERWNTADMCQESNGFLVSKIDLQMFGWICKMYKSKQTTFQH